MTTYTQNPNPPTFNAIQYDGSNASDVLTFLENHTQLYPPGPAFSILVGANTLVLSDVESPSNTVFKRLFGTGTVLVAEDRWIVVNADTITNALVVDDDSGVPAGFTAV